METNIISSLTNNSLTRSETFEMFDDNNADSSPAKLILDNFYILVKILIFKILIHQWSASKNKP